MLKYIRNYRDYLNEDYAGSRADLKGRDMSDRLARRAVRLSSGDKNAWFLDAEDIEKAPIVKKLPGFARTLADDIKLDIEIRPTSIVFVYNKKLKKVPILNRAKAGDPYYITHFYYGWSSASEYTESNFFIYISARTKSGKKNVYRGYNLDKKDMYRYVFELTEAIKDFQKGYIDNVNPEKITNGLLDDSWDFG